MVGKSNMCCEWSNLTNKKGFLWVLQLRSGMESVFGKKIKKENKVQEFSKFSSYPTLQLNILKENVKYSI